MSNISFLDKIRIILDQTSSSILFIIIFILMLFFCYIIGTMNEEKFKNNKKKILIPFLLLPIGIIIFFFEHITKLFDSMMNNLFVMIYFPNISLYISFILITNIIVIISLLNSKISKVLKMVNIGVFLFLNFILILILNIIKTNELDPFSQTSLYSSNDIVGLVEISSVLFFIWILFLIIYKVIIQYFDYNKSPIKEVEVVEKIVYETKKEIQVVEKEVYKEVNLEMFTLADYKKMLEILKKDNQVIKPLITKTSIEEIVEEKEYEIKEEKEYETELDRLLDFSNNTVCDPIEVTTNLKYLELQELYKSVN